MRRRRRRATLLERFLARGATKFVLIPLAREPAAWLRELYPRVVAPLEAAGAFAVSGGR